MGIDELYNSFLDKLPYYYRDNVDIVWELFYLYQYKKEKGLSDFEDEILFYPKTDKSEIICEYVKCSTHNIPIKYLYGIDTDLKLIETRRCLEDIIDLNGNYNYSSLSYLKIAQDKLSNNKLLYELRRFVKEKYLNEFLIVCDLFYNKGFIAYDWRLVDFFLRLCLKSQFSSLKIESILDEYLKSEDKNLFMFKLFYME